MMRAHVVMVAVGLCFAGAAVAEPAKPPVRNAEQNADAPKPVLIAAADERTLRADDPQQDSKASEKPARRARVTTCRCGNQDPSD